MNTEFHETSPTSLLPSSHYPLISVTLSRPFLVPFIDIIRLNIVQLYVENKNSVFLYHENYTWLKSRRNFHEDL